MAKNGFRKNMGIKPLFCFSRSIFSLCLSFFLSSFDARLTVFLSCGTAQRGKRGKFSLQRVVSHYSEIGSEFFTKMILGFVGVTLLGLVRISKTRYLWKDLSLLTFLFIVLIAKMDN